MPEDRSPETIELQLESRIERLVNLGPSMWGRVYRTADGASCYRILERFEAPARVKGVLQSAASSPRKPGIAPITEARSSPEGDRYLIRYEIRPEFSLGEAISGGEIPGIAKNFAEVFEALPGWWTAQGSGLLPMPADIVFAAGVPHLLAFPGRATPSAATVFADPRRIWALSPEMVRGVRGAGGEATDLYCLGAALLQALYRFRSSAPGDLMLRVANQTAFSARYREDLLPRWVHRLSACRSMCELAEQLVRGDPAERSAATIPKIAKDLTLYSQNLDPRNEIEKLREQKSSPEALELIQDMLLTDNDYDLHVLAGDILWRDQEQPLQALESFEKAIALNPARTEAYVSGFHLLQDLLDRGLPAVLAPLMKTPGAARNRLETILRRNFGHLPPRQAAEQAETFARYLLLFGLSQEAAQFIYPRLFENGKYQWWKFGRVLAYAEALMELGQLEKAGEVLENTRQGLVQVRKNQSMDSDLIQRHGRRRTELEAELMKRKPSVRRP